MDGFREMIEIEQHYGAIKLGHDHEEVVLKKLTKHSRRKLVLAGKPSLW